MGVLVGVNVTVGVRVAVRVGVRVAVGVTVAVGVAVGPTTPGEANRNWSTVAITTARGKMVIFRYSPNFAETELRKFFSLAQSPLEHTATQGNCQVRRPKRQDHSVFTQHALSRRTHHLIERSRVLQRLFARGRKVEHAAAVLKTPCPQEPPTLQAI